MRQYIVRRLFYSTFTIIGVAIIAFGLIRLAPGDSVILKMADAGLYSQEDLDKAREELGIDKPIYTQFGSWMWDLLHGDLGESMWWGDSVGQEIKRRLPVTLELAIMTLMVSITLGVTAGIIAAVRQFTVTDYAARILSIVWLSIPNFWLGTVFIMVAAIYFHWTPPLRYQSFFDDPSANLLKMFLPALALGLGQAGTIARMTRSSMLEVLRADYVRTARAKGLAEMVVVNRHALKNALIPVVTIIGTQLGYLLGGVVLLELIFGLPGLGRFTVDAIGFRDYTALQGSVLFFSTSFVLVNLTVDLIYAWLDPRIRYA